MEFSKSDMRFDAFTEQDKQGRCLSSTRHRIRHMEAIMSQLKAGHQELNRLWTQFQPEPSSGNSVIPEFPVCAGERKGSRSAMDKDFDIDHQTQRDLMRLLFDLKQNVKAIKGMSYGQIEIVTWPGVGIIEKDIQEKEIFLHRFLTSKYQTKTKV